MAGSFVELRGLSGAGRLPAHRDGTGDQQRGLARVTAERIVGGHRPGDGGVRRSTSRTTSASWRSKVQP